MTSVLFQNMTFLIVRFTSSPLYFALLTILFQVLEVRRIKTKWLQIVFQNWAPSYTSRLVYLWGWILCVSTISHSSELYRERYRLIPWLMTCNLVISRRLLENKNLLDSILQHEPCPNYLPHCFSYTQVSNVHDISYFIALETNCV